MSIGSFLPWLQQMMEYNLGMWLVLGAVMVGIRWAVSYASSVWRR